MSIDASPEPFVVIAGATGDLGGRIAGALIERGATVHALTRPESRPEDVDRLANLGVRLVPADLSDPRSVAGVLHGASCVVSALSGLREVILDRQTVLLDAAVRAGVPRFISSDYSSDYTKTRPGHNRNFDLRREFAGRADRAPIQVTSILSGAFMDMLGAEMPIIQPRVRAVLYWGDADQPLDFTTRDDTAASTAAAALDEDAPRILRVAGDTVSAREIASAMTKASGKAYRVLPAGGLASLRLLIPVAQRVAAEKPDPIFPAWQGMQYTLDMFSGEARLDPLDNDRYPELEWTSLLERLSSRLPGTSTAA